MDTFASCEIKFSSDTGQVTGYGAVFNNVDHGKDRISKGAFRKTLRDKPQFPMLFSHDHGKPLGVWKTLKEDDHGLRVSGKISDTEFGKDIRTLAKDGAVTGLSIGFWPVKADYQESDGVRVITEIDLLEVSLVTFPMNDLARVQSVKSAIGRGDDVSREDVEFLLRWTGLSRRKTKRLLDGGYAGLSKPSESVEALNRLASTIRGFSK